ncbi:Non-heme dioxygenase N-terminal domain-containing protein [Artemisia annua]|uniref:Non-heme dioxygenase N-terminal domain-containing protein n=1 Tax=Artemisia annua TaxID=35608 RepID=A0A2U1LN30_ARTAN|nr:Non-heme dioxygenase N-terminal domain-containing protein [Artemisia annua]
MAIPVIDFSKLNGEERAKTMAQIANGCEEWGFFQLVNHGIPEELLERVKKVSSECYKREREEEFFKNSTPVKLLRELVDKKSNEKLENIDWEDVFLLSDDNEWPPKTLGFKETMTEYRAELKKLAEELMVVMDENLGIPKGYIKNAFNGGEGQKAFFGTKASSCSSRMKRWPDGLQILKGGEWIDVQPLPNSIVINTGDQIEVLSNGRYKSVWHRVNSKRDGTRRSIASFYNPSYDATIAPASQLVTKENEDINTFGYPKFVFGDYMTVYSEQKFLPKEPRFHAVKTV